MLEVDYVIGDQEFQCNRASAPDDAYPRSSIIGHRADHMGKMPVVAGPQLHQVRPRLRLVLLRAILAVLLVTGEIQRAI